METIQASSDHLIRENAMSEARKDGLRCIEKVPKCWIFSEFVYLLGFITVIFTELTVISVEIEQYIVLL